MKLNILSLIFPVENGDIKKVRTVFFHFQPEGSIISKEQTVCLSRNKPGECNFSLETIHEHAPHSPAFTSSQEFAEYVERITNDIRTVIKNNGYEPEKDLSLVVEEKVIMPPAMLSMN
ncbi:hypothetical protein HYS50_03430 [Candidatus Woesearchaeota archaeon]|nr:hypothetical protein [Candidatus Woesearchaeota archaeon]